jgi:hypothetical protein
MTVENEGGTTEGVTRVTILVRALCLVKAAHAQRPQADCRTGRMVSHSPPVMPALTNDSPDGRSEATRSRGRYWNA